MHAYLIIAHNEFEVLTKLIGLLDDNRNDIYVHIDKKVEKVPALTCKRPDYMFWEVLTELMFAGAV